MRNMYAHVWLCIRTYVCMHEHMSDCYHAPLWVQHIHIHVRISMNEYIYNLRHMYVCTYVCTHVRIHLRMWEDMYYEVGMCV